MQFLYPIGFLALAGLIIPLIIHLWSVKQGKTLKIGSIALLGESAKASSKSLKINDWLLFCLRCALLIIVSIIITQPYLQRKSINGKGGWILVDRTQYRTLLETRKKTVDSLLLNGYELRGLSPGFPKLSAEDTLHSDARNEKLNYTSILQGLNQIVPRNYPIYLFSERRLALFGNELPKISYRLKWQSIPSIDTSSSWISESAGKKYEAKSSPSTTIYRAINNPTPATINVKIKDDTGIDRKYLVAALKTIAAFTKRKINIDPAEGQIDIAFWLSEKEVSSAFKKLIKNDGSLFQYGRGKLDKTETSFAIKGKQIPITQKVLTTDSSQKIWTDGFRNPILTRSKQGEITVFTFYSRFNPQWNNLVWDEIFTEAIMPFVLSDNEIDEFGFEQHPADQRTFPTQTQLINGETSAFAFANPEEKKQLDIVWWAAAFVVFLIERIISFKNKKYADS